MTVIHGEVDLAGRLPQFQSDDTPFQLMQNSWGAILNPIIGAEIVNSSILEKIALTTGNNSVNHKLGRTLKGWIIVRQRGAAQVYDSQDNNSMPNLTLVLVSSASVNVDLLVF